MKIFTAEQIREMDCYTIEHEPIPSAELMERAALACFHAIKQNLKTEDKILVFCGTGNNGGDGMALTRILNQNGFYALAFLIKYSDTCSQDNQINYNRLKNTFPENCRALSNAQELNKIPKGHYIVLIDALVGTGLNKKTENLLSESINFFNDYACDVKYSIDISS